MLLKVSMCQYRFQVINIEFMVSLAASGCHYRVQGVIKSLGLGDCRYKQLISFSTHHSPAACHNISPAPYFVVTTHCNVCPVWRSLPHLSHLVWLIKYLQRYWVNFLLSEVTRELEAIVHWQSSTFTHNIRTNANKNKPKKRKDTEVEMKKAQYPRLYCDFRNKSRSVC